MGTSLKDIILIYENLNSWSVWRYVYLTFWDVGILFLKIEVWNVEHSNLKVQSWNIEKCKFEIEQSKYETRNFQICKFGNLYILFWRCATLTLNIKKYTLNGLFWKVYIEYKNWKFGNWQVKSKVWKSERWNCRVPHCLSNSVQMGGGKCWRSP